MALAATEKLFEQPEADYTRTLISAVPVVSPEDIALRNRLSQGVSV